jgi:hypothetical protein
MLMRNLMRNRAWVIPALLLGLSLSISACGDDDETCGDTEALANADECDDYGAEFLCANVSFNADTDLCTVSGCQICGFVVDDLDDF